MTSVFSNCFSGRTNARLPFAANTLVTVGGVKKPIGELSRGEMRDFLLSQEESIVALLDRIGVNKDSVSNIEGSAADREKSLAALENLSPETKEETASVVIQADEEVIPATTVERINAIEDPAAKETAIRDLAQYIVDEDSSPFDDTGPPLLRDEVLGALQSTNIQAAIGIIDRNFARVLAEELAALLPKDGLEMPKVRQLRYKLSKFADVRENTADSPVGTFSNFENAEGRFAPNGNALAPLGAGKVRPLVAKFLSKLAAKIPVSVYASRAALASARPELFAEMVATNPRVRDANSVAAVYYQGKVYVFGDSIYTNKHLQFVLAHEVLGHHGLRSIIPRNKLNTVLLKIYNDSASGRTPSWVATEVDHLRHRSKALPLTEAIEEVLADRAAALPDAPSVFMALFRALRSAIKRLFGVENPEDLAQYVIHHARYYVRTGGVAASFDPDKITKDIADLGARQGQFERAVLSENAPTTTSYQAFPEGIAVGLENSTTASSWGASLESLKGGWDTLAHDWFSLQAFSSRENPGYNLMSRLFDRARSVASDMRVRANETLSRFSTLDDETQKNLDELLFAADALRTSEATAKNAKGKSVTLRELSKDSDADQPLMSYVPVDFLSDPTLESFYTKSLENLYKTGLVSREKFAAGFTVILQKSSKLGVGKRREAFKYKYSGTKESLDSAYEAYVAHREAYRDLETSLVARVYGNVVSSVNIGWGNLRDAYSRTLTSTHREALITVFTEGAGLVNNSIDTDGGSIVNRDKALLLVRDYTAAVNTYLRGNDLDPNAGSASGGLSMAERAIAVLDVVARHKIPVEGENAERYKAEAAEAAGVRVLEALETLRRGMELKYDGYTIQKDIRESLELHLFARAEELNLKWSLVKGYTPIYRTGNLQLTTRVVNPETGAPIKLSKEDNRRMLLALFPTSAGGRQAADNLVAKLNEAPSAIEVEDSNGEQVVGRVVTRLEIINTVEETPPNVDPRALRSALSSLNLKVDPAVLNKVMERLTKPGDYVRARLEREWRPGIPFNGGLGIAKLVEQRSSIAGKAAIQSDLSHLFGTSPRAADLWHGGAANYARLQRELAALEDRGAPEGAIVTKRQEVAAAKFMFEKTNPGEGKPERGKLYLERAIRARSFFEGQSDVELSSTDMNKGIASLRTVTSIAMLGGTLAAPALNILSMLTNVIPFLATFNRKRAFGGGFGWGKSRTELARAGVDLSFFKGGRNSASLNVALRSGKKYNANTDPNNAAFYDVVAKRLEGKSEGTTDPQTRLTRDEALFLAWGIRFGKMVPAISNIVMYSARGVPRGFKRASPAIDLWMSAFNQTEQYARRVSGLAAYRLYRDRALAADPTGVPTADKSKIHEAASAFAGSMLDVTVGEYSAMNRPPGFKDGALSLAYMFQAYPTTALQLVRNLDKAGQAYMISALWLMGGLTALPWAGDLEDVADMLAQRLLNVGSSRLVFGAWLRDSTGVKDIDVLAFRGALAYFGAPFDVGSRVALNNPVPFTGLLAGDTLGDEALEFAGPMMSMITDSASGAWALLEETTHLAKGDPTEFAQAFRKTPVSAFRYASDMWTYHSTGAVTTSRGQVQEQTGVGAAILARALGFYPASSAQGNSQAQMVLRSRAYNADMSGSLRDRAVRAMLQGREDDVEQIYKLADEWNEDNPGNPITNFRRKVLQTYKLWRQTGGQRLRDSTPAAHRARLEYAFRDYYTDEDEEDEEGS